MEKWSEEGELTYMAEMMREKGIEAESNLTHVDIYRTIQLGSASLTLELVGVYGYPVV